MDYETIYSAADRQPDHIPWAKGRPNALLTSWLQRERPICRGRHAVVVGCGLGDDAELLSRWGFSTTAFDVSPSAIAWCCERFASTRVDYRVADLFALPGELLAAADFVFEANTVQALPPDVRPRAVPALASLLKPGGRLLLVTRGRDDDEPVSSDGPPFPLSRAEVGELAATLRLESFEELFGDEPDPIRRFRASFVRDL